MKAGTSFIVGLGTGAVLLAGLITVLERPGTGVLDPVLQPVSAPLSSFADCAELDRWLEDNRSTRGPAPVGSGPVEDTVQETAAAGASSAVSNNETGTNVQETGVDEPDIVKVDGELMVQATDLEVEVYDVSQTPRKVSTIPLAKRLYRPGAGPDTQPVVTELLLTDSQLIVSRPAAGVSQIAGDGQQVTQFDLSDPQAPELVTEHTFSGFEQSTRLVDGVVRIVTSTSADYVDPESVRPSVLDSEGNRRETDCTQIYRPGSGEAGMLAVFGFDVHHPDDISSMGVANRGDLAYTSSEHLVIGTTNNTGQGWFGKPPSTGLHLFDLSGTKALYRASGTVEGHLKDRWSMDVQDSRLRVAVHTVDPVDTNRVVTFDTSGDRLVETGRVGRLGPDEEIKSVRWFDDFAILVTFRETDPLYVVDFSDPARPRLAGELKIPGFSGYLHPIGPDRLLGLGIQDARNQVSLFDLSDHSSPQRIDVIGLDRMIAPSGRILGALADPREFTWTGSQGWFTTVSYQDTAATLFRVDTANDQLRLQRDRYPITMHRSPRIVPLPDGRMLFAGGGQPVLIGTA